MHIPIFYIGPYKCVPCVNAEDLKPYKCVLCVNAEDLKSLSGSNSGAAAEETKSKKDSRVSAAGDDDDDTKHPSPRQESRSSRNTAVANDV